MADNIISNRIKELREARGLSQAELAHELNVTQQTVAHWESGTRDLKTGAIVSLARFFNVTSDYLLGLSDYKNAQTADIGAVTGLSEGALKRLEQMKKHSEEDLHAEPVPLYCLSKMIENEKLYKVLISADRYIWSRLLSNRMTELLLNEFVKEEGLNISQKDIFERGIKILNEEQAERFNIFKQAMLMDTPTQKLYDADYTEYILQKELSAMVEDLPNMFGKNDKFYSTEHITDYEGFYSSPCTFMLSTLNKDISTEEN